MGSALTARAVPGVGGQPEHGATVVTLEAAAVEEQALGTQPLHHVHALAAEETHAARARRPRGGHGRRLLGG